MKHTVDNMNESIPSKKAKKKQTTKLTKNKVSIQIFQVNKSHFRLEGFNKPTCLKMNSYSFLLLMKTCSETFKEQTNKRGLDVMSVCKQKNQTRRS